MYAYLTSVIYNIISVIANNGYESMINHKNTTDRYYFVFISFT